MQLPGIYYICESCGTHKDVSLEQSLNTSFNQLFKNVQSAQIRTPLESGVVCANGCGFMRQVQADDRLCFVEKIMTSAVGLATITIAGKRYRAEIVEIKEN